MRLLTSVRFQTPLKALTTRHPESSVAWREEQYLFDPERPFGAR